jgi:aryl-alcohol dehydrogenase-like predicted oxidoreductase
VERDPVLVLEDVLEGYVSAEAARDIYRVVIADGRVDEKATAAARERKSVPRVNLADDYSISRVIKGGWQLAGDHGPVDPAQAPQHMATFVEAGITTFDCADIYTGVESMIGEFRARYPELARKVRIHTKFVPDLQALEHLSFDYVEHTIRRSLRRLRMERLDLVQFHWWDYAQSGYVQTALELKRLREAGLLAHIGVTNFDIPRLEELVHAGVPILSHQVQYSLLDDRPAHGMVDFCRRHGIALLCYGTVAGGFLSDRWLGRAAPEQSPANRSLAKYKLIMDDFGGWDLFQKLLKVLRRIADRRGCDIATVASRAMLARPGVAAVIVGATDIRHLADNCRIGSVDFDEADADAIEAVTRHRTGPTGDVYTLERDRNGRHGRIMKYDLNR